MTSANDQDSGDPTDTGEEKETGETGTGYEGDVVLGKLLRQLNVELDRFNVLFGDAHGLHQTDLNALVTILDAANRQEPMTPSRLAAALDMSVSATTALLERLESLGHITRERSEVDRRRVDLDIHDTARQVGGEFYRPLLRELGGAWDGFSAEQRETIRQFLVATIDATGRARETFSTR
ncbi:DNA-binding MarR family transcriptional regulator [Actinopolyspora lacussalsi]|nr:DNA-binding MarR family transcriptional regulator [Actinopolyspora lacussalsi]